MEYPHLKDTQFPHINTEDVWKYRNLFDYTRWGISSALRLCNVNYTPDYSHVVDWESASARDAYFTNLSSSYATQLNEPVRLETIQRMDARVHRVKVPIPFDVASRYNYLQVTLTPATSAGNKLNFETDAGIQTWYFFIREATYRAPSATELELQLDIWTSYRPYIDVQGYLLERGHAPVAAAATPDDFLEAPCYRTDYLLASDIDITDSGLITQAKPLNFTGEKFYCFTLPYTPEQVENLKPIPNHTGGFTNPVYYDTSERNGYQKGVRGYEWNVSPKDFDNAQALTPATLPNNGVSAAGLFVYAVTASQAPAFFAALKDNNVNILRDIGAVFAVNKNWVSVTDTFTLYDTFTVYHVEPSPTAGVIGDISFTVADFNFPNRYKKFTKLYMSPYCKVTVTDNVGNIHELNVQDLTGETGVQVRAVIGSGVFKTIAAIVNVNATGDVAYSWTNARGQNANGRFPLSQADAFLFENDIPLYTLTLSSIDNWNLDNYATTEGARLSAITSYQNSVAGANNSYENTVDSADVSYNNAVDSANTGYTNAEAGANTGYANAVDSANTGCTNAEASANTVYTNAQASNANTSQNTDIEILTSSANQNDLNANAIYKVNRQIRANYDTASVQNSEQLGLIAVERDALSATQLTTGLATAANVLASGNPVSGVSSAISGVSSMANSAIAFGVKQTEAVSITFLRDATNIVSGNASSDVVTNDNTTAISLLSRNNTTKRTTIDNTIATSNANALRSRNTSIANADRSRDTSNANSARSRDTSITNADRSRDTSNANSARSRDVTKDNADYSRDTSIENAKRTLETTQNVYTMSRNGARLGKVITLADGNGDITRQELALEGYTARLSTPKNDNVRRLGDYFARYGYASGEYFSGNVLQKMKNFTYIHVSDVQFKNLGADANALNVFSDIMKQGVTVWSDPEKVNAVSIYDNWE